jgi:hypothetical protein
LRFGNNKQRVFHG